jgi:hypothetical protein
MNSSRFSPERFLRGLLSALERSASENISRMPSSDNLPQMEPHLLALYNETYYVTLLGLHNVSIIMQGVLLEVLVKEIIYDKEKVEFQKPFGPAIKKCENKGYLDAQEIRFLKDFKNAIRNIYQHVDIKKLTQGLTVAGWRIKIDKNDVAGSLLRGIKAVKEGRAGPPTPMTTKKLRPVGYIIKETIDRRRSLPLFQEVDKFVKDMLLKYLSPAKK